MLQVTVCSSKTHRHPPETSLETHTALLENGHLCYFCSSGSMIPWDTRIKILKSDTVICKKNIIECPWEFFFFKLSISIKEQITYSNLYCSGIYFNTLKWWGVFRLSRKGLLFIYSLNKHFFSFWKKNCRSAIYLLVILLLLVKSADLTSVLLQTKARIFLMGENLLRLL